MVIQEHPSAALNYTHIWHVPGKLCGTDTCQIRTRCITNKLLSRQQLEWWIQCWKCFYPSFLDYISLLSDIIQNSRQDLAGFRESNTSRMIDGFHIPEQPDKCAMELIIQRSCPTLTHWNLNICNGHNRACAIFWKAVCRKKIFLVWLKYHLVVFLGLPLTVNQHWFRWWLDAKHATC